MAALHDFMGTSAEKGRPTVAPPIEFPGRWVGGAVGVVATVIVGGALRLIQAVVDNPARLAETDLLGSASFVAFLGVPVAFVLGRHLAPVVRDEGSSTLGPAVTFALLAPPLGDIEIIAGLGLAPWLTGGSTDIATAFAGGLLVGGVGLVVSYVALPVTAVVAVVWVILMRALPRDIAQKLAMPSLIARIGVRHVAVALVAWVIVAWSVWMVVRPAPMDAWS